MYICYKCKALKSQLDTTTEAHEYFGQTCYKDVNDDRCSCGGEFEEAILCPICHEWQVEGDFRDCCEDCKTQILTVENSLLYINAKKREKEFFVEWYFDSDVARVSDELIDLCAKHFDDCIKMEIFQERTQKELFDFVKNEFDDFVEWYKEV